jgi:hypothetical protein
VSTEIDVGIATAFVDEIDLCQLIGNMDKITLYWIALRASINNFVRPISQFAHYVNMTRQIFHDIITTIINCVQYT